MALFDGPGEARARARAIDWQATPAGPPPTWGHALRAAVRLCLDSRSAMAVWIGPDFVLVHNDAYAAVLGGKAPAALGQGLRAVWGEVWDLLEPQFRQVFERGEAVRHEEISYLLHRHGREEETFFTYALTPVREEDGRIVGVFNMLEETTGTVKARSDSENRYRALFRSISEGFCIVEVLLDAHGEGADYRFLEANPAFERHTGLRGAIGKTARELIPDLEPHWPRIYGRIATTGRPERFADHSAAMARWFEVDAFRIGVPGERKVAMLFRDITERRQAEADLQASRAHIERERAWLQLVLDTLPVGLYLLDRDGGLTLRNEVERRIWAGSAPLGSLADYDQYKGFSPQTGERLQPGQWPAALALQGQKIEGQVVDIERFDGSRGTLLFSAAPLRGEAGQIDGAVVAIQDVSELRAAQAQLQQADAQKNEFLAVLSHELRNPLAPIRNSLQVLDRVPPGSVHARKAWEVIGRQVEQLANLVNDLLDVTRITQGKVRLQRRTLDLNELARSTLDDHLGLFERAGISTHLVPAPHPVLVDADWNRLAQAMSNLLQNAAKFTPAGGRVDIVATDAAEGMAELRVVDTGVGMAPRILQRLFQPFAQADDTLDRSQGGLGLGLALVRQLAELHGGSVQAHSGGAGQGSAFAIRLPLQGSPVAAPPPPAGTPPASASRRVLLIEDNLDAADSLRLLLELQGHAVAVAHSGPEGLVQARAFRPDLILCDIGLPGMDGYAVARAVRADPGLPGVLLVALSGYALPEDIQRALAAGFDRHLPKPPDLDLLWKVIEQAPARQ